MQPTLVILAAGMASRYGSMKQTQSFGPSGETIMDYSIYDAIRAGFTKVVFIIREDFAEAFKVQFEPKLKGKIETAYVYQDLARFVDPLQIPADRTKPWGTAHAVICAKDAVQDPFTVINADDFYGRDAFQKAHDFLRNGCNEKTQAIIGYELARTLSENGTVSRGVCQVDEQGNLASITERTKIYRDGSKIVFDDEGELQEVPVDSKVSMNFWCFDVSIFDYSLQLFRQFVKNNQANLKAEFFIPIVADEYIREGKGVIRLIPTSSNWFGVTYKEDAPSVQQSLDKLVAAGDYPQNLWAQ